MAKLIKCLCYSALLYCFCQICFTTFFYERQFSPDLTDEWWYVERLGLDGKNIKFSVFSLFIIILNALPFIQWKDTLCILPTYRSQKKGYGIFNEMISYTHMIVVLFLLPYSIYYLFSCGTFDNELSNLFTKQIYGYHPNRVGESIIFTLFILNGFWLISHEVRILVFKRVLRPNF